MTKSHNFTVLETYVVIPTSLWWGVLKRGAGSSRSGSAEKPCLPGQGPPHSPPALHHRGLSSPPERNPTGNFPQPPFSTAEVLLQFSLPNLWFIKEHEGSKFSIGTKTAEIQAGLESFLLHDFKTKGEQIKWLEKLSQTHRDVLFRHSAKCHPTLSVTAVPQHSASEHLKLNRDCHKKDRLLWWHLNLNQIMKKLMHF